MEFYKSNSRALLPPRPVFVEKWAGLLSFARQAGRLFYTLLCRRLDGLAFVDKWDFVDKWAFVRCLSLNLSFSTRHDLREITHNDDSDERLSPLEVIAAALTNTS
jgi:hypothetical protein